MYVDTYRRRNNRNTLIDIIYRKYHERARGTKYVIDFDVIRRGEQPERSIGRNSEMKTRKTKPGPRTVSR